ncbi:MAG: hypothetical protein LBQ13_00370 [Endomicrobium sp.]|jgi:hypothetical protein|nr:hypothetical protein [Endomicrobium sp.]
MHKNQSCLCPHCELELKNGCMSPKFCRPCGINAKKDMKVSEYAPKYDKVPLHTPENK